MNYVLAMQALFDGIFIFFLTVSGGCALICLLAIFRRFFSAALGLVALVLAAFGEAYLYVQFFMQNHGLKPGDQWPFTWQWCRLTVPIALVFGLVAFAVGLAASTGFKKTQLARATATAVD